MNHYISECGHLEMHFCYRCWMKVTEKMTSGVAMQQSDKVAIADRLDRITHVELGEELTMIVLLDNELIKDIFIWVCGGLLMQVILRVLKFMRMKEISSDNIVLQSHRRAVDNI